MLVAKSRIGLKAMLLASALALACGRIGYENVGNDPLHATDSADPAADDDTQTESPNDEVGDPGSGGSSGSSLPEGLGGDGSMADGGTAGGSATGGGAGGTAGGAAMGGGAGGNAGGAGMAGGETSLGNGGGAAQGLGGTGGEPGAGGSAGNSGGSGGTAPPSGGGGFGGSAGGVGGAGSGGTSAGGSPGVCVPDAICSCGTYQGHDYRFCPIEAWWPNALADCQSVGMDLVRVDDQQENDWLRAEFAARGMFTLGNTPMVFLGGNDTLVDDEWRWSDGELFWANGVSLLYTNWSFDPRRSQNSNCLGMLTNGTWEDRACNSGLVVYACESR